MSSENLVSLLDDLLANDYRSNDDVIQPGVAVLIAIDNQIIYQRCIGFANIQEKESINCNTNFRLASVSKQFIAYGIILLEQQNKLTLQDNLGSIFSSDFEKKYPTLSSTVHIQHLLDHSSGLIDYEDNDPLPNDRQWSDNDVLNSLKDETYFQPGSQYRYSNTGYVLLGLIIEIISGQRLGDFLQTYIFKPYSMETTTIFDGDQTQIINRAFGYAENQDKTSYILSDQSLTSATRGDGGIYMSISDYFQWYKNCPATISTVYPIQGKSMSAAKYYSQGWFLSDEKGQTRIHSGHSCGFTHQVYRIDEEQRRVLVVYFSNMNENNRRLENFNRLIIDFIPQLKPHNLDLLHCLKELTR